MKRGTLITIGFLFIFIILSSNQAIVNAQSVQYSPASLTINQSMRSTALGGATVAIEGYPGAALINPATIGIDQTIQVQSYLFNKKGAPFEWPYLYIGGSQEPLSFYSPTLDIRYNKWAISVSIPYYNLNAFKKDNQSYLSTKGNFYDYALQLAGAWEINRNVRIGIGFKHFDTRWPVSSYVVGAVKNDIRNGDAYAMDLGVLYHKWYNTSAIHTKMSLGGSLLNFGTNMKYNNGMKEPLPLTLNAGLGIKVESSDKWFSRPFWGIGIYGEFSHFLARVDDNGHPYSPFKSLVKGWAPYNGFDGQNTYRIGTWDQIERRLGLEASLFDMVSVRWGIDYQSPKMISYGMTHRWGLGFDLYYLAFDYTTIKYDARTTAFKNPKHIWQATVRIPLSSSPRNFWPDLLKRIGIF